MIIWYREPTLEDLMSDSLVSAVMEADSVDPRELKLMLSQVAREMKSRKRPVACAACA